MIHIYGLQARQKRLAMANFSVTSDDSMIRNRSCKWPFPQTAY